MSKAVAAVGLGAPLLLALLLGPGPFGGVVVVVGALVLVDTCGLLSRVGSRPVVLIALLPGVGMPLAVARNPDAGWEALPGWFVAALVGAFVLVLVFGRRSRITDALGSTMLASLLIGLGASSLLLLRDLDEGLRWVLGFGLVAVAADLGTALVQARQRPPRDDPADERVGALLELGGPALGVAVGAGVLGAVLDPPFTPTLATLLGLVALTAGFGGDYLLRSLALEAGVDPDDGRAGVGEGLLLGVADAVLLGAPAAYVLARSAAL
ncbi:MAG: hypothetical protein M3N52_02215 [Actinomycetota bacterium]|nr:hypothetical protein [Actinomycetota bacterium]